MKMLIITICLSIIFCHAKAQQLEFIPECNINTHLDGALANKNNVQQLVLYYQNLKELPDYVAEFQKLVALDLSGNQLLEVPKVISRLINLSMLNLSNNKLQKLPDFMCSLHQMKVLILANNNLEKLPNDIFLLKKLTYLDISGNPIPETEIDMLKKRLPECEIGYNTKE